MPRQRRIIIPNEAHHITQRGNYRQKVFEEDKDFQQYLIWLQKYADKYRVDIFAYCLMHNHIHFIGNPNSEESFGKMLNVLAMRYSQYINKKRRSYGHVWQGRYFSCVLDEQHLYRAIRYVERNPVRAGMIENAWNYEWSSALSHLGKRTAEIVVVKKAIDIDPAEWEQYLKEADMEMVEEIRQKTKRGMVVGTESFVKKLEKRLNRSLMCQNPGRPKKRQGKGS